MPQISEPSEHVAQVKVTASVPDTQNQQLFNENITNVNAALLEQYKLYVQTANETSTARMQTNMFFAAINTILFTFIAGVGQFTGQTNSLLWVTFACAVGIVLSASWYMVLSAYRNLNSARFNVIRKLEEQLPANIYSREWQVATTERPKRRYIRLTLVEQRIPQVFGSLYVGLMIVLWWSLFH